MILNAALKRRKASESHMSCFEVVQSQGTDEMSTAYKFCAGVVV